MPDVKSALFADKIAIMFKHSQPQIVFEKPRMFKALFRLAEKMENKG